MSSTQEKQEDLATKDSWGRSAVPECFELLLGLINFEAIEEIAYDARMKQLIEQQAEPVEDVRSLMGDLTCRINRDKKMTGSYNVVFTILWSDKVKWILRIPGKGLEVEELDDEKMNAEYGTMEYIRVPFALIAFVEGSPLYNSWFDGPDGVSDDSLFALLDELAKNMAQLYRMKFDKLGMMDFSKDPKNPSVRPVISTEFGMDETGFGMTIELPQQTSFKEMLRHTAGQYDVDGDEIKKSAIDILKFCITSIPEFMEPKGPFYLTIPDFDMQNVMVDDKNKLTGFIDMDNVMTLPACAGCARYPMWITEDWTQDLPGDFDLKDLEDKEEEGMKDADPADKPKFVRVRPPFDPYEEESLEPQREHYLAAMIKEAGPDFDPRVLRLSPIVETIRYALDHEGYLRQNAHKLLTFAKVSFTLKQWSKADKNRRKVLTVELREKFGRMWKDHANGKPV